MKDKNQLDSCNQGEIAIIKKLAEEGEANSQNTLGNKIVSILIWILPILVIFTGGCSILNGLFAINFPVSNGILIFCSIIFLLAWWPICIGIKEMWEREETWESLFRDIFIVLIVLFIVILVSLAMVLGSI